MPSNVYFTDFRIHSDSQNLLDKLQLLMKKAGAGKIDFNGKLTAIKLHFGELGCLSYLRPNYARAVADFVKSCGGKPFLTDCNTLYVGSRKNALEHLDTAMINGFTYTSTGCQVIIGDGLKGNDEVEVPVPNGVLCKTAKIGRAIMDADVFISLTHFKGHEAMGIGGTIKNIGMGCGSRAGKMEMHSDGKPGIDAESCIGCGHCKKNCANDALTLKNCKMTINRAKCTGCGRCLTLCPRDAIQPIWEQKNLLLTQKTAEYASAVVSGRPCFHVSLLCDISPNCDCHAANDTPIVPNIGMLASFDPVAIDVAAVDLCNKAPRLQNTWMDEQPHGNDLFNDAHNTTNWRNAIDHAVKIGLGSDKYTLIKI